MRLLDTILQLANNESCLNLLENETFWSCVGFILQNSLNGKTKASCITVLAVYNMQQSN